MSSQWQLGISAAAGYSGLVPLAESFQTCSMSLRLFPFLLLAGPLAAMEWQIGASREDVTPTEPIRLTGYAARKANHTGVAQKLWAKALAISVRGEPPAILLTVDNCGVCAPIVEEVARRLKDKAGVPRERLAVCSSHTHCGPMSPGFAANIFVGNDTQEQQATIQRYGSFLTDKMETAALRALESRRAATLSWNEGRVCFAANRRTQNGPVDHALPVLCARNASGGVLAVVANYACHCTTLGGDFNETHGDWAGCAQEDLERLFPGAVALITAGTGADANPAPRGSVELAQRHGAALAEEAAGRVRNAMLPLAQSPRCELKRLELPFQPLPTRHEWESRAQQPGIVGLHARRQLEKLDRGEALPEKLPYVVQTWSFGEDLAMVFLAGEVVVDYGKWLKHNFDAQRLWVTSYSNDVPCYIPSRRILQEGGYEAESSLWYYDRPARLAPQSEEIIEDALSLLLPTALKQSPQQAEMPPPKEPAASLAAMRVGGGLLIEQVATEPQIADPICLDWDSRGRLWVLEMSDYPLGVDGHWGAGGRVKILTDQDGDGKFEKATLFLDGLKFPTGLLCWPGGVWICAAPDILWVADADADDKPDKIEKRYSGWATNNFNARVNGLALGLDHWIHGSGGLLGGEITNNETGEKLVLRGRDFRFHPHSGKLEAAAGNTQQGRPRDDWDHWFGCDNTHLLWHYPMPDHYLRRNDQAAPPAARVEVPADADPNQLFPTSRTLERFNQPELTNRTTSACGLGVYRDDWLGAAYYGNVFTCEPVHNLLRRHVLEANGVTFKSRRAPGEEQREFFSSRDNWSRFTQARTGPDGALWLVDMYRFVIEHPTWIPEARQKALDLRAGSDRGRIYRIRVPDKPLRTIRDLTKLSAEELTAALDSPNGTDRDRVHAMLLVRHQAPGLERLLQSPLPQVRAQALCVLDGLGQLTEFQTTAALADSHPEVRVQAIRLSEKFGLSLANVLTDSSPAVRFQAACSSRQPTELAQLGAQNANDPWIRTAVLSSAKDLAPAILRNLSGTDVSRPGMSDLLAALAESAKSPEAVIPLLLRNSPPPFGILAKLLQDQAPPEEFRAQLLLLAQTAAEKQGVPEALHLAARCGATDDWLLGLAGGILADAALEEISRRGKVESADKLAAQLSSSTPAVKAKIIRTLRSRKEWEAALLSAVKSGKLRAEEIPWTDRQELAARHSQAAALLGSAPTKAMRDRIKALGAAETLSGDASRGTSIFVTHCGTCHALAGLGQPVGPDLASYRGKPAADFVASIVNPNAVVEPAFVGYELATKDGRTRMGLVRDETANGLTLVQPGGLRDAIRRADLLEIKPLTKSLMPEGLDQVLQPQDVADLLAWLKKSAPPPLGSSSPEQAARSRAEFLASVPNGLAKVATSAGKENYASWMGPQPMHYCRLRQGENQLTWHTAALPATLPTNAPVILRLAVGMGFWSQPDGAFQLKINGREALTFHLSLTDAVWPSGDGKVTGRYAVREANAEDACGLLTLEIHSSLLQPSQSATLEVLGDGTDSQRWFAVYEP